MDYKYLDTVPDGDTTTEIKLSIKGFQPSTGGSGHAPPGFYEVEIAGARFEAKKGGKVGRNLHLETRIYGPENFRMIPLHWYMPTPKTSATDDVGYRQLQSLVWGIGSWEDKLEAYQNAESFGITPKKLVGKRFFVELRDGKEEYSDRSEIARVISKQEYSARPGPRDVMTSAGPAQTETPEVLPSNGAGAAVQPAKSAADQVLFG